VTAAERRILAAIFVLVATVLAVFGVIRHWRFGSSYDLAILDQAVWHLSRFEAPASTVSGFSNVLGDHFSPIIVMFVPLYWLSPRPELLIAVQAALFAASIFPIFLFLRSRLSSATCLALSGAAILFWGIQRAASSDVHEIAFAPLVIATAVLATDRRKWRLFWVMNLLLACIKEDLIPLASGFGVYLFARGDRRIGLSLLAVSVLTFVLVMKVAIPAFNDGATSAYLTAYSAFTAHPWRMFVELVTPPLKLRTIFLWLAPFLFLPLASPLSLLTVPIAVSRLLSDSPLHWGPGFHYSAPLAPLLATGAGDGLARLARRLGPPRIEPTDLARITNVCAAAILVLCAILPGRQPFWRVFGRGIYAAHAAQRSSDDALARVPADASVVAQAAILPHLTQRREIFVLGRPAPGADYVIANRDLNPWPARRFDDLRWLLDRKRRDGYTVEFESDGWTVLKRPAGPFTPTSAPE
jgi:uncharacterized membrane protein